MNSAIPVEPAEKRVFRAYWQDGSLDLFGGVAALAIGLSWISHLAVAGAVLPALFVPLWAPWRRRMVEPRLGQVRFGEVRRMKMRRGLVVALALGTGSALVGVAVYFGFDVLMEEGLLWLVPGVPAMLLGLMAVVTGIMLGLKRFLYYGLSFFVGGILVVLLGLMPGWGMLFGGFVTALSGFFLFLRFLREFPVASAEME